ncbi:MAG: hypothetical protein FWB96_09395 [Defluviitaleaceae bacterium]|nr:hypothetical protein [Defluviitaleaceae bacterium]MCL2263443.1 hypothetical protein [Defluviitaleaceae bacterium]
MTQTDCKAVFSLQREILNSPKLTDEEKVKMLKNSINNTIGEEKED